MNAVLESSPTLATVMVVDVKVRNLGHPKKIGAGADPLAAGDYVLFEHEGDLTYGVVCAPPASLAYVPPMRAMMSVTRRATDADLAVIAQHQRLAREGLAYCRERAAALKLPLKLVEVYSSFRRQQSTFVYTADQRVDFRQLVRDLARRFGGRIEMRHVAVREEARRLGGVDTCGLPLCCSSFLIDFVPVSLKKIKHRDASFNESHMIGLCGRLKCCLMFELPDDPVFHSKSFPKPDLITPARGPFRS
jgi:cell fate regulator YaaT (PSP1 superfamily)